MRALWWAASAAVALALVGPAPAQFPGQGSPFGQPGGLPGSGFGPGTHPQFGPRIPGGEMPGVPGMRGVPGIPTGPGFGGPFGPRLPRAPGVPGVPGFDDLNPVGPPGPLVPADPRFPGIPNRPPTAQDILRNGGQPPGGIPNVPNVPRWDPKNLELLVPPPKINVPVSDLAPFGRTGSKPEPAPASAPMPDWFRWQWAAVIFLASVAAGLIKGAREARRA